MTDDQKAEWKRLALWTESELQELCCGFPRHESRIAPNGPKRLRAELVDARDMIDRAVEADRLEATVRNGERRFDPAKATAWAAAVFPAFPFKSEDFPSTRTENGVRLMQEAASPAPRPVQRQRAQEAAILAKLAELGVDAQAVPAAPAGKPSPAKQAVRAALGFSPDVMNKAWQRLRRDEKIKDACSQGQRP